MPQPYIEQGTMNVVAWTLVVVGIAGALASIVGLVVVGLTLTHYSAAPASAEIEGHYYVLRPSRGAIWAFIVSLVLSVVIACSGYIRTDRFVNRTLQRNLQQAQ